MQKHHTAHLPVDASDEREALIDAFDLICAAQDYIRASEMMAEALDQRDGSPFVRILSIANDDLVSALHLIGMAMGREDIEASTPDALLDAINVHREAETEFRAAGTPGNSDGVKETARKAFATTLEALSEWEKPAESRAAAVAALRLAAEENAANFCSDVAKSMVAAALAFFEREAGHDR